jgi:hypothetical protein
MNPHSHQYQTQFTHPLSFLIFLSFLIPSFASHPSLHTILFFQYPCLSKLLLLQLLPYLRMMVPNSEGLQELNIHLITYNNIIVEIWLRFLQQTQALQIAPFLFLNQKLTNKPALFLIGNKR